MIRDLRKNESLSNDLTTPLYITVKMARDPKSKFIEVKCMIDSGLTVSAVGLPQELADQLAITPISSANTMLANGKQESYPIGEVALIVNNQGLVLNCLIGSAVPIIGLPFLKLCKVLIEDGEIKLLQINQTKLQSIKPYSD